LYRRRRATAFLPRWATGVRFELILPRVGMDAVRAVAVSALTSPSRMATRSARRDARAVGMTSSRHPSPSTDSLIAFHEALPGLSRPFARRTSTADRPAHYFGGGQGRRVAAEEPGEGWRADRARARRSWPGIRLHLLVIAQRTASRVAPPRGPRTRMKDRHYINERHRREGAGGEPNARALERDAALAESTTERLA
jgi:hypothetical protein